MNRGLLMVLSAIALTGCDKHWPAYGELGSAGRPGPMDEWKSVGTSTEGGTSRIYSISPREGRVCEHSFSDKTIGDVTRRVATTLCTGSQLIPQGAVVWMRNADGKLVRDYSSLWGGADAQQQAAPAGAKPQLPPGWTITEITPHPVPLHVQKLLDKYEAMPALAATQSGPIYSVGQTIEVNGKQYRVTGGDPHDPNVEAIAPKHKTK